MSDAPASASTVSGPVIMRARRLRKRFGGQIILDDASFELRPGEVVLLRGPNGSGKTTLLNILTGNLHPDAGVIEIGATAEFGTETFDFPRSWWRELNPLDHFTPERIAKEGVSRTWQDIRLFPTHSLRDNVVLAIKDQVGERPLAVLLERRAVAAEQERLGTQADGLLARFGLAERETSSGDMVSLGQSKRVAIARTVQAGARILFLDEPLAALDTRGISDVMSLLAELATTHKVTLVIVEHVFNIPRVLDLATTVWTIRGGGIEVESPEDVRKEPMADGTFAIRSWLGALAGSGADIVDRDLPGGARLSHVALGEAHDGATGLEVRDLVVERGRRPVIGRTDAQGRVEGLSFDLPRGRLAVLQAPNGWGKTTFLEALAGTIPIRHGEVRIFGRAVQRLPTWERVGAGLTVLQSRDNAFPNLTVDETLDLAGVGVAPDYVKPFLGRHVCDLSGGERQKVAVAAALAGAAGRMSLLDEPFGMLDEASIARLQGEIAANRDGVNLILVPAASQS